MYIVATQNKTEYVGLNGRNEYVTRNNMPFIFNNYTDAWNVWNRLDNFDQELNWKIFSISMVER